MTETTTKSGAILKREALRLMDLSADGDWPESVTPGELADMQYPSNPATPKEVKKLLRQKRLDLAAEARKAIDAGELPTVPAVRQVSALVKAFEMRNSWVTGGPRRVTKIVRAPIASKNVQAIERLPCRTWLDAIGEPPNEYVRAWLGPEYEAALKVGSGKAAPAADSRPGERIDYFRSLWLELNKPARNDGIWKAIRSRAGKQGCPITSTTGNEEFVFQYSDGCTDRHDKSQFQKNMSLVRKG
jgi:hypothetical protein